MKNSLPFFISIGILINLGIYACDLNSNEIENSNSIDKLNSLSIDSTLFLRYASPENSKRIQVQPESFEEYLRNLPLKEKGSKVKFYDGGTKSNQGVYDGVVDMSLGKRDLQQCADAVMRLRAEYLYEKGAFEEIKFNFLSDGKARYYSDYHGGDFSRSKFLKYLDYIFSYANTSSLHDELRAVDNPNEMKIGDVFIQKGRPYGHAVIVVDMAENKDSGQKYFILAQSYMPAQDTQILINPNNKNTSPWYEIKGSELHTPEWNFTYSDLRRFE